MCVLNTYFPQEYAFLDKTNCFMMDNFLRRRIDVATLWASNRISVMDTLEKYEESYAIAEEFREWIVNIGQDNENLTNYVMNFPKDLKYSFDKEFND